MIVIFYGTSAELIKMVGVIRRVPRSELLLICSSQHHNGLKKVHKQLDIYPDIDLSDGWFGKDVMTIPQMAGMMLRAHGSFLTKLLKIRNKIRTHDKAVGTKSIAIVHGDTLTTVIGSYMGRWLGLPVAHVEAGLRTHNWRSPFPEEIDRRVASKFARIHYAPSDTAEADLIKEHVKGVVVNTQYNTAKDAIELSSTFTSDNFKRLSLPKSYCLVLLHRTELIENKSDLKVINKHASIKTPVVFTEHSTTWEKIRSYGFEHYLEKEGLTVIPKQPYFDFMAIVGQSEYIVTDGGGLQEDAFFLGIPTVIHRKATERQDGLGFNAELSGLDTIKVESFLNNHLSKSDLARTIESTSPSQIVVDHLKSLNYTIS
jgi:UDP-N-acetylglucosamine 2-epimerase (non-hydrolysing)